MTKQISTAELATEFETDGRTVRKFLRSITPKENQPGKGSRWVIPGTKTELNKLRKQFNEWTTAQAEKAAARDEEVEEVSDEVELDD